MTTRSLTIVPAALLALGTMLLAAPEARADRRIFPYTYGYMTLPAGGFEIEHYLDAKLKRFDDPSTENTIEDYVGVDWRHQIELEYGITDHWDFGFYNVFEQKQHKDFKYRGVKLRTRYRFGEEGEFFVDPAAYLELVLYSDQVKLEEIIILAKKFGDLEIALNLKFEQGWKIEHGEAGEVKFEFIPSLGLGYHITDWLAIGIEYVGKIELEEGELEQAHYLGPAISFRGSHFYWSIGAGHDLAFTEGPELKIQARSLFGIVF